MTSARQLPLREVIEFDCHEVLVEPSRAYQTVGVRSFGRGLFLRPMIEGSDTSYSRLYQLRVNQIVLSRLFGWEGAVAQVSPEFDGLFVSPEFPTFTINTDLADPHYMGHFIRWAGFQEQLAGATRGLGQRRQRVHADALLAIEVPLPSLDEQRALADHLNTTRRSAERVLEAFSITGVGDILSALPDFIDALLLAHSESSVPMTELAEFVSDTVHPGDDPDPADRFVGLQHVESHTGRCLGSEPLGPMKGRKFRFQPGDVIFGYLRPYLNKVWVADCHGLCSVDQYVLRPRASVDPELLGHSLRGRQVLDLAIEKTHNLQLPRLRSGLLAEMPIPLVAAAELEETKTRLRTVTELVVAAKGHRIHQLQLAAALLPSAMNEAFGSLN